MANWVIEVEVKKTMRVEVKGCADEAEARRRAENQAANRLFDGPWKAAALRTLTQTADGEPPFKMPEEWEVYSTMPGAGKVNAAISAAVRKVCAGMKAAHEAKDDVGPALATKLTKKYVDPVFTKYRDYGTYDSEPGGCVRSYLRRYARFLTGDENALGDFGF